MTYVEAGGLECPEPMILMHNAVIDADIGDTIILHTTEPYRSVLRDISRFCQFLGHDFLSLNRIGRDIVVRIRKG